MKKLLSILTLIAGVSFGYEGVFATLSPYLVESATMEYSTWTNSVLWITPESPVISAGTTDATYVCYAKLCMGNGYQQIIASQPSILANSSGTWFSFDGADDRIIFNTPSAVTNALGAIKVTTKFILRRVTGSQIIHSHGTSAYRLYINTTNLFVNTTSLGVALATNTQYTITTYYNAIGVGTNVNINGSSVWTGTASSGFTDGTSLFVIGANVNTNITFAAHIKFELREAIIERN